jgi:anaerobic C4-dicarboxylate transporter
MSLISSFSWIVHTTFGTEVSKKQFIDITVLLQHPVHSSLPVSLLSFVTAQQDGTVLLCIPVIQGLGVHKLKSNV